MSKFLTPPVWYDENGNLVEILTGKIADYGATAVTGSMAIGKDAHVGGNYSVAVGSSTIIYDVNTTAIGYNAVSRGNGNIVIGYQAESVSDSGNGENIAIGQNNAVYGDGSIAIGSGIKVYGYGSKVYGNESIAIGSGNKVYGNGSIAIGSGITLGTDETPVSNTIQIGATGKPYTFQVGNRNVFDAINIAEKTFYINAARYTAEYDPASGTLNFITM